MKQEKDNERLSRFMDTYINIKVVAYSLLFIWAIAQMSGC